MRVQQGYLGQGRNVEENSSFILCSIPDNGSGVAYSLKNFDENFQKGNVGKYQKVDLIVKSYGGYERLSGPYNGGTVEKYIKRLMTAEEEGRKGATDPQTYAKNIMGTSNMKGLVELMKSEDRNKITEFQ